MDEGTNKENKGQKSSLRIKRFRGYVDRFDLLNTITDGVFTLASLVVVDILALMALVAIGVSTWGVGVELVDAISNGEFTSMTHIITSTLTVFIFIEVLSVSIRYLKVHHIDLKDLIDVTLAIIFRETWVGLFSGKVHWQEIAAYAILIAVLGAVRWLTLRSRAMGDDPQPSLERADALFFNEDVAKEREEVAEDKEEVLEAEAQKKTAKGSKAAPEPSQPQSVLDYDDDELPHPPSL